MNNLLKAKSEFRKRGVTLFADKTKSGFGGSWKFASEDNLINTIQIPLSECGLELISTMDYLPELGIDSVKVILFHVESGESISSTISISPITPKKDKNGNPLYLDAEIEKGKQFGYWSRILSIRLLGLSDIDPEDIHNRPVNMIPPAQATQIDPLETPTQPVITTQDLTLFFNTHKEGNMDKLKEVFSKYPNWKEANSDTLSLLLKDMNNVISN